EGIYQGRHRTRDRGSSTEFYDYRAYTPGDPTQLIDWKLYGRTDRLYIRRFHQESQLTILLIVDGSASMQFGGFEWARRAARNDVDLGATKFRRACELAATLAYLGARQGDRVGLLLSGVESASPRPVAVPPGAGWNTFREVLTTLTGSRPRTFKSGPGTALTDGFSHVDHLVTGAALIVGIGDGLEQPDPLIESMSRARYGAGRATASRRREVSLLQVLTDDELDIGDLGGARLVDAETGVQVRTHSDAVRSGYRERFEAHRRRLATGILSLNGRYQLCALSDSPVDQLRRFLT
ncbi:MAG: DUF58 domain-containing protein, partial [Phycisphaerales bacterium]|nr:DUF58 domain-containing protein [Phycisphaerales bacterium]